MMRQDSPADPPAPSPLAVVALVVFSLSACASASGQAAPEADASVVQVHESADPGAAGIAVSSNADAAAPAAVPAQAAVTIVRIDPDIDFAATMRLAEHVSAADAASQEEDAGAGAVRVALEMVGTPYVWGGNSPKGFDCSGLVQYSYSLAGLELPRVTIKQRSASRAVPRRQLRPGDLLFFHIDGKRYSHIGIYIGEGEFVHAPRTGKSVTTASLSNPYWQRHFGGARRPVFD